MITLDAIHAATALLSQVQQFSTGDAGFSRIPGLAVQLV